MDKEERKKEKREPRMNSDKRGWTRREKEKKKEKREPRMNSDKHGWTREKERESHG